MPDEILEIYHIILRRKVSLTSFIIIIFIFFLISGLLNEMATRQGKKNIPLIIWLVVESSFNFDWVDHFVVAPGGEPPCEREGDVRRTFSIKPPP